MNKRPLRTVRHAFGIVFAVVSFLCPASLPAGEDEIKIPTDPAWEFPRIAMLWSAADRTGEKQRHRPHQEGFWQNVARHDVVLLGAGTLGLEWTHKKYHAMAESFTPKSLPAARENLARIKKLNPHAVVLVEVYFFEDAKDAYPPEHQWWLRDKKGDKKTFWPGTWRCDITSEEYINHVARRIAAVYQATGEKAGIFLDNVRLDEKSRTAWEKLLHKVRLTCGADMPILVNAGWNSQGLLWLGRYVNGIMYEDSINHLPETDLSKESYYRRISMLDKTLRPPRISVNEVFGRRDDVATMRRELIRTLVYTDMSYLYSDSTHGHRHRWHELWDAPLGQARDDPQEPAVAKLARRDFAGGTVLWLPKSAKQSRTVKFDSPMLRCGDEERLEKIMLKPGHGEILLKPEPDTRAD